MTILSKKNALVTYGIIDIIRGILHTIFVKYASQDIAGIVKKDMTLKKKNNIRILMAAFGSSNLQTGIIKILLSQNKLLENEIFLIQFLLFIFNSINFYSQNLNDFDADLPGRYLMSFYGISSLVPLLLFNE